MPVSGLGCVDQIFAGKIKRTTAALLVAGHNYYDVHIVESTDILQCRKGLNNDHVSSFHIANSGTARGGIVDDLVALKGAIRLEYRI